MRKTLIGVGVLMLSMGGSAMLGGIALSATSGGTNGTGTPGAATNTCRTMDQQGQFVPDNTTCSASATGTPGY